MRVCAFLCQRRGAREFRIEARIDLGERMNDRLTPIMADDFDGRDLAAGIAINKFLRRLLESFGLKGRGV